MGRPSTRRTRGANPRRAVARRRVGRALGTESLAAGERQHSALVAEIPPSANEGGLAGRRRDVRSADMVPSVESRVKRASKNLPHVQVMHQFGLNVYDILKHRSLVIAKDALGGARGEGGPPDQAVSGEGGKGGGGGAGGDGGGGGSSDRRRMKTMRGGGGGGRSRRRAALSRGFVVALTTAETCPSCTRSFSNAGSTANLNIAGGPQNRSGFSVPAGACFSIISAVMIPRRTPNPSPARDRPCSAP